MPKLSQDIIDKFHESIKDDDIIGEKLAKKIYETICAGNYSKATVEAILREEINNNEDNTITITANAHGFIASTIASPVICRKLTILLLLTLS